MPKKRTTEEFIAQARSMHGDRYDYSKVRYVGYYTKILIICRKHGEFMQLPGSHVGSQMQGCPECWRERKGISRRLTRDEFIEKSRESHGDKYNYDRVIYKGCQRKVIIGCPEHGWFEQLPVVHQRGHDCPECAKGAVNKDRRLSAREFIKRAKSVHGDLYDYSEVNYKSKDTKVNITCKEHGVFQKRPHNHVYLRQGCPECSRAEKRTSGEKAVMNALMNMNVEFKEQVYFDDCCDIRSLPFDFLVNLNGTKYLIEFDGDQHFKSVEYFGGERGLKMRKRRDKIKDQYAAKNGYILIRLRNEHIENMEEVLSNLLFTPLP